MCVRLHVHATYIDSSYLPPSAAPSTSALVLAAAATSSATSSATASALALLATATSTATLLLLRLLLLLAGGKANHHLHALGNTEASTRHGLDGSSEGLLGGRLGNSALIPATLLLLLLLLLLACLGLGLHVGLPAVAVVRDAAGSAGSGGTAAPGLVGRLLLPLLPVRLLLHLHRRGLGRGGDTPARRRRGRPLGLALPDGLVGRTRLLGPGGGIALGTWALLLGGGGGLLASVLDEVIEGLVHIRFRG
mmetsp:Transcript_33569/g.98905  ORF Transcript_33569/g.98905 Transcript_33569/m.98905 type:complete len:250 (-) Transcript_33569:85-834(-)